MSRPVSGARAGYHEEMHVAPARQFNMRAAASNGQRRWFMWRVTTIALVALAELVIAAPALKDPPKKDSPIVGKWRQVSVDGQDLPYFCLIEETFRADGTMILFKRIGRGEAEGSGRYAADLTADPSHIDFMRDNGELTSQGIFKVDGDTLTICFRVGGRSRPYEFGEADTRTYVFERVKPKE